MERSVYLSYRQRRDLYECKVSSALKNNFLKIKYFYMSMINIVNNKTTDLKSPACSESMLGAKCSRSDPSLSILNLEISSCTEPSSGNCNSTA